MPTISAPQRSASALSFQLHAAIDLYRFHLDELECAQRQSVPSVLNALTDCMRDVRIRCAAFPALNADFIELLIGHSEMVFKLSHSPHSTATYATLTRQQRQRAEMLLQRLRS